MSTRTVTLMPSLLTALLLASCGGMDQLEPASAPMEQEQADDAAGGMPGAPPASKSSPSPDRGEGAKARRQATGERAPDRFADILLESEEEADEAPTDKDGDSRGGAGGEAAPTRAWFPETFLFEPAIVTDAQGLAQVPVTVPDRLTTWRVLALAHDRQGHQAGDQTSFLGTLPVYVDPVVPAFLVAGDRLTLPVQVVNSTDQPWSGPVRAELSGASSASWQAQVAVGPGESAVLALPLAAPRAGSLSLELTLGKTDAVRRSIDVHPRGRKLQQSRSGTLAAARSFTIIGERDMDPHSAQVRVTVSPGALALLRRELTRSEASGGTAASDAYGLLLSGSAPALLQALGEPLDEAGEERLRDLGLRATQRVMGHALAPDTATAALLLPAAAAHPDQPVLSRLAERLADQLAREQRPDGTFMGGGGATVQRMLVGTAEATAALRSAASTPAGQQRAARVQLAASAAFERHQGQLQDPYTAAAVLVSGATSDQLAEQLRDLVRQAVQQQDDGSKVLPVPIDVQRSDGSRPSQAEATALAALALAESPQDAALVDDLAAGVLGAWSPGRGWGDGRSDLWGTRAVTTLLRDPLPDEIVVLVERDGVEQARGVLTGDRRNELLVLEAPGSAAIGSHQWTVRAEPAVPGLAFTYALDTWVPWPEPRADQGIEVQLSPPDGLAVGRPASLELAVAAPRNTAVELQQPLPAGVQVDTDSLSRLVIGGSLSSFEVEDGLVRMTTAPQDSTAFSLAFRVVPTLAGSLHAGATLASPQGRPELVYALPGQAWVVR